MVKDALMKERPTLITFTLRNRQVSHSQASLISINFNKMILANVVSPSHSLCKSDTRSTIIWTIDYLFILWTYLLRAS